MLVNPLICVFLLSCFEKKFEKDCPPGCECYTAPKDGDNYDVEANSLICKDLGQLLKERLKVLEPINTLYIDIKNSHNLRVSADTGLYVNNVFLNGVDSDSRTLQSKEKHSQSSLDFIGLDNEALRVLTFSNLNINEFNWNSLKAFKSLKVIQIEKCLFNYLKAEDFNHLNAINIISVTISGSQLNSIEDRSFKGWNLLKILSLNNNQLTSLDWALVTLPELWYLDLNDNNIMSIPDKFFISLPKLRVLKLDRNNLKTLQWSQLEPVFSRLKEFSLQKNTLCASKEIMNIYSNLKKGGKYPRFYEYSMYKMWCQDVTKVETSQNLPSGFPCRDIQERTYEDDPITQRKCSKWPGGKH